MSGGGLSSLGPHFPKYFYLKFPFLLVSVLAALSECMKPHTIIGERD